MKSRIDRFWVSYGLWLLIGILNLSSMAIAADAEQIIVQRLLKNCRAGTYEQAKLDLTLSSHQWLDRWARYELNQLIPSQVFVVHRQVRGEQRLLWLSQTNAVNKKTGLTEEGMQEINDSIVLFLKIESGRPKVDIPESMQHKFGNDWVNTVSLIESSYRLAVGQLGVANSKAIVESLLRSY